MSFAFFGHNSKVKRKQPPRGRSPQPNPLPHRGPSPPRQNLGLQPTYPAPPAIVELPAPSLPARPANPGWSSSFLQLPQVGPYFPPERQSQPPSGTPVPPPKVINSEDRLPPELPANPSKQLGSISFGKLRKSIPRVANQISGTVDDLHGSLRRKSSEYMSETAALADLLSSKLDAVITSIDGEIFSGDERELEICEPRGSTTDRLRDLVSERPRTAASTVSTRPPTSNHFSKVWLYTNSRLPPHLPPFKVYMPTYPLLCLAAQFSEKAYSKPTGSEKETHVDADWRTGTKAMVLKSVPIDDMNTVVFAIRGSQTFMDWTVNYRDEPLSPKGFLDDSGNLCHAGFLHVARQMIHPVASRLRTLLQEQPSRSSSSLLITGHSAGGAVAALLYAHMLSKSVKSELHDLTTFFKRVHCVTFGAPPVSLLPLTRPDGKRYQKSLFFSFINEGDPVSRADKAIVKSLLKMYASPAPYHSSAASIPSLNVSSALAPMPSSPHKKEKPHKRPPEKAAVWPSNSPPVVWKVPSCTLSCAGRIVLLREKHGTSGKPLADENIEACVITDEQLRNAVFGDPVCHMMKLYVRRIEILATKAVTCNVFG